MSTAHRSIAGIALAFALHGSLAPAIAQTTMQTVSTRPDWAVKVTPHPYQALVQKLEDAVKANKMGVVNAASASEGAKAQGITIPGNRVVGVFRNDFARRMLAASLPAGIEAPVRFYVTENADGSGSLSYRLPSAVFAPYFAAEGGDLRAVAGELDIIFAKIAADAIAP